MRIVEHIGQVYGTLTVVARAPNRPPCRQRYWLCVCTCGKQIEVIANSLAKRKGCGRRACSRAGTIMTGRRIGPLTVGNCVGMQGRASVYVVTCDCGRSARASVAALCRLKRRRLDACFCLANPAADVLAAARADSCDLKPRAIVRIYAEKGWSNSAIAFVAKLTRERIRQLRRALKLPAARRGTGQLLLMAAEAGDLPAVGPTSEGDAHDVAAIL